MSNQHRATPEQWEHQDHWTREHRSTASCILELRARIEALEAAQQDKLDRLIAQDRAASAEARPGGLVERVTTIISLAKTSRGAAEDVLSEVAAAAKNLRFTTAKALIDWLERESEIQAREVRRG
jgi:response regulator of citrate/malate metabolism